MRRHDLRSLAILAVAVVAAALVSSHAAALMASQAAALEGELDRGVFRKEPYLIFPGVTDEMQILWQLHATAPCTLDWGTDLTYSLGSVVTSEYGAKHQHQHTLTGLTADALCQYRVRSGETRTGSFRAAPPEDATRLKFLAYGDTRTYPADHDAVAERMISTYQTDPDYQTLAVLMGDFVSDGDDEADWDGEYFPPAYANLMELYANVPTQAVRGNHEGAAILYASYFPGPYVVGCAWSFDYGPAHFVIVDQYVPYNTGSAQLEWIENDLAASDKIWKFMCLHEPGWSSGGGHSNEIPVQDYLHPLCVEHGVQIVFGGHNHYYARAVVDGIQHMTVGGGGAPLRTPDSGYPYIVTTAEAYHFAKIAIDGPYLTCEVIEHDGTVLDSFALEYEVGVEEPEPAVALLSPGQPNPFGGDTIISYFVPRDGPVKIRICNAAGRLVRTILDEPKRAGTHTTAWNGRDRSGEPCAAGVYFCSLEGSGFSVSEKLVLIR